MAEIFNPDNRFWRMITRVWQICALSLLWFVCSLPLITIGASTSALYKIMLQLVRDEEGYIVRNFFKAFISNLKQGTVIWMVVLVTLMVLAGDLFFCYRLGGTVGMIGMAVFFSLLVIVLLSMTVLFAFQAWFCNRVKDTILNSVKMALGFLPYSGALLILMAVMLYGIYISVPLMIILGFFGMGIFAYISAYLWRNLFDKIAIRNV